MNLHFVLIKVVFVCLHLAFLWVLFCAFWLFFKRHVKKRRENESKMSKKSSHVKRLSVVCDL